MSAASIIITDPVLLSVLTAAHETRQQCNSLLDCSSSSYEDTRLLTEHKTLSSRLAILRALNRKAISAVRSTKQETTEKRQEIDALHLQLQNLYYEQRHLRGEIRGCEDYDHKYPSLHMIPVEEFLSLHPEYSNSSTFDHDLTVARIENEYAARKALEEKKVGLEQKRDALIKKNESEKAQLAALDEGLEKWMIQGREKTQKLFDEGRVKE